MDNDHEPYISLLDLSSQIPFEMDDAMKKDICFGETLIISCGHYEGEVGAEESDSEWSCEDTTLTESSLEVKEELIYKPPEKVEEKPESDTDEEDKNNDFHFFFFPDCDKPSAPVDSKASIIVTADGLPKINLSAKDQLLCICRNTGKKECECFSKLLCKCGAKTKAECVCTELKEVCICDDGNPQVTCTCEKADVCTCFPNNLLTSCTCGAVDKPCICHEKAGKFPSPVCTCIYKPIRSYFTDELKSIEEDASRESREEGEEEEEQKEEKEPCICQKPDKKKRCFCRKGRDCICGGQFGCLCEFQKSCVCEPSEGEEPICKSDDNKSTCKCDLSKSCSCEQDMDKCCFPKHPDCICGDPNDCKCFEDCKCTDPCICGTEVAEPPECSCLDRPKQPDLPICTCRHVEKHAQAMKKLKRVRATKHGYRWCHEVDSHHTYFDYGYGKHDKIPKDEDPFPKVEILGLYDERTEENECPVHGIKAPPYTKKVRKASIDCCSSVGGISICVETLGEDKDKFLVQVVSNSSKEGAKCSSKISSILDCNLHTMEENRTEHITKKDLTKERKNYMAICEGGYYNKVTRTCGERTIVKRFYHTFENAKNLLLEGANIVFLRYIALRRYRGTVKTDTVTMNGVISESIYVSNGVSQAVVNGKPLFVVKVERHIIEPTGVIHQTLTVLTLRGYTVSHEWADTNYMFHINPLLNVNPETDEIEEHMPLRERWREDLQLLSDYLDFKTTRTSEGGRYVTEGGGLTGTVRDYLQAILLLRPNDTLHFTRHYFSSALSSLDLPHTEYFDPTSKHVRYYYLEE